MSSPQTQTLYQIHVETSKGHILKIGPKAPKEFLTPFVVAINKSVALGKERDWSNPVLVETQAIL
jgi:hypothetical protein